MDTTSVELSSEGKTLVVPATVVSGRTLAITGRFIKIAQVHEEEWQTESINDPQRIINDLRERCPACDVFSFAQKLPETDPKFPFPLVWDNVAAVRITSYADWWENKLPQETRKNVRRAAKRGVTVAPVEFDDSLVAAIESIYNETPVRQGRPFWHYKKPRAQVKSENASYLSQSQFLGAFCEGEMIGFLKMVHMGPVCALMQIVSKVEHTDKRPTNALLAKAVELCADRGSSFFLYGKYHYGRNSNSPLAEFKHRNGFEPIYLPRYYVPLTLKGRIYTGFDLHRGYRRFIPAELERILLQLRGRFFRSAAREPAA